MRILVFIIVALVLIYFAIRRIRQQSDSDTVCSNANSSKIESPVEDGEIKDTQAETVSFSSVEQEQKQWYDYYFNSELTTEIVSFLSIPTLPYKIVVEYERITAYYDDGATKVYNFVNEQVEVFKIVFYTTYSGCSEVYGDTINKPLRFAEAINKLMNDAYIIKEFNNNQVVDMSETSFRVNTTLKYIELTFPSKKCF